MALALPASSVPATSAIPLISLRETVAKISMPTVLPQLNAPNVATAIARSAAEPVYNLTITNGEIVHSGTATPVPKAPIPGIATLTVPRENEVATTNPKPIIVTVSGLTGMPTMQAGKQLTSVTNVITGPMLSAPIHMVTQHFTTDKIPQSTGGIVTIPAIPRMTTNPVLTAKPRQITPLLPTSILTTSKGPLVITGGSNPLLSTSGVMTTVPGGISINNNIVTVTPVIMTSSAPLMTISGNPAMTLNPMSQGQVISGMIQPKLVSAATNKAIIPTAFLKPVNITTSATGAFPVTVQPLAPTMNAILAPAPVQSPVPVAIAPAPTPPVVLDEDVDPKCDPKNPDFDPIHAMEWKDGIATLPGSTLKFKLNEFGTLEMVTEDLCNGISELGKPATEEVSTTTDDGNNENRQKSSRKEMYQDESSMDKTTLSRTKDTSMSEELVRCENCDCFGLKMEFCKSGRFCSLACSQSYANKKNAWMKRGATKEKIRRKRLKVDHDLSIRKDENGGAIYPDETEKQEFDWNEYLNQEKASGAPEELFNRHQTFPINTNQFQQGMKLEGIDHKHPSLFCVLTVSEVKGYRLRLHFDGYSEVYDFWVNADSLDIFPVGWCARTNHQLQPPKGFEEFDWENYLRLSRAEEAPKNLFFWKPQSPNPYFKRGMKLEAVDKKNSSLVCVTSVADVMDCRFLIHFDGWEDVYDYWSDSSSPHLHPINWCRDNNLNLTPPKEIKDTARFNWSQYLNDTKSSAVPFRAFKPRPPNEFKIGMKLEAVDRRNPSLIRVATVAGKTDHTILLHFDGWSSVYDYWIDDDSSDLHPINWCARTGHPLESPIVVVPGQAGPCPTPGCNGLGHIKGPKYTSHYSAFGCPYSQLNLNKLDSTGQDRVVIARETLNDITKRANDLGGATDGLRKCPTPGCNGVGHVKGKYSVHHRVSGCPLAEMNAIKLKQQSNGMSSVPTSNENSSSSTSSVSEKPSAKSVEVKADDSIKTRNGLAKSKKNFKIPGLRGRPPKNLSNLRAKAQDEVEKKPELEEKVHDSVFNPPFVEPPMELPMSWEHNTQLIPGLSSIKGSAARKWSVNQVAKFVSSLKGCEELGKVFREQLIDGEALLEMQQSDFLSILHFKLGPSLKVYSCIVAFKESEKFEQ